MVRQYFVRLPLGYDSTRAYPLVIQGPGCGGNGLAVYELPDIADEVIKVGLTPPDPAIVGHVEAPGAGCFDDKEGDDSVDWPFYEAVLDTLRAELCYDEQRVFASGNSSGAWLANELGCKYAGNSDGYAIRGIAVNEGGIPTDPTRVPTCSQAPMAGMWIWKDGCCTGFNSNNKVAIARAMQVNGCSVGTNYDNTSFEAYPIGGDQPDDTCKKIQGCPDDYPLVVCVLPGNGHGSHDSVANPGFATFMKSLAAP
jgi:poly(3-hydroxybutyrate) depolymerase